MKHFPEYLHPGQPGTVYVNGGFGALGNPAAFHNPAVRSLRLLFMSYIVPMVGALNRMQRTPGRSLEQIFDRLSLRRKGTSATAEAWHRDQAALPNPEREDVFGGWINLDLTETQYFSGVPGTHVQEKGKAGFARLSEAEVKHAQEHKQRIPIPPGHHFIFYGKDSRNQYITRTRWTLTRRTVSERQKNIGSSA
jgi:hypothetical protein